MDWNRVYLGIAVIVLGITGYYGWPFVRDYFAKRRVTPAEPATSTDDEAYKCVKKLQAHAKTTGNAALATAAVACGVALFREPSQ